MDILLLDPRALYLTARFAEACRRQSIDPTILLLPKPPLKSYLVSYANDTFENVIEVPNPEERCEAILPFLPQFDAVVPTGEFAVVLAETLADRMGLFHNPLECVSTYRNKHLMRVAFAKHGVDQPKILSKFGTMEDAERFDWDSLKFPVVVKPVDMSASLYVRLCDHAVEAKQVLRRIFKHTQSFSGSSFVAQGLVEEVAYGPEYSAECIVQDGRVVRLFSTTKFVTPFPACDEVGHLSGESLDDEIADKVFETVERIVRAWSLEAGVMHIEYKVSDGRVKVIEGACRIGGDMISELVELKHGVSLEECLLLLRARRSVDATLRKARVSSGYYYAIKYLFAENIRAVAPSDVKILRDSRNEKAARRSRPGLGYGVERRLGHQLLRSRSLTSLKTYVADLGGAVASDCGRGTIRGIVTKPSFASELLASGTRSIT
jgi:biotin carboxylase